MKKILLLLGLVSGSLFAQAPQNVPNVGQINWWGYPNCTWTMNAGVINAPCLAGTGGSVLIQTNGTNNSLQTIFNLVNGPTNSGFSINFTNPTGGTVSPGVNILNQNLNTFFAGPSSGSPAQPSWRTIVPADLPVATGSTLGVVKPDNSTVTISGGVLSAIGGGGSGVIHVITANGATPDGILLNDGAMTNGSAILTSASGDFTPSSVGKYIEVVGAIAAGNSTLETTIASYQSATQVTLASPATATISGAQFVFGTNNTATAQLALDNLGNAGGGTMLFPAPTTCPTNATCGYIIATTDEATSPNPSGLKIRQSNIKLQGENNGIYTNIFTRGAWSNISSNVVRGHGISVGDSSGNTSVANISIEGLHLWSLTTGQTSNTGIAATVALNGDGWDISNKGIFIYPNVPHLGGVQIKNCYFEEFKGENIYSGGLGLPSLLVQNVTMVNSNASMISSSAPDLRVINSTMKYGWNGAENGLFNSTTTVQMFVNNVISHMGASGITVTGVDATNTAGAIEMFGNQIDTIGMIYASQQRSGFYIGIQSGNAPSKLIIDHNTCVDCYDFLQSANLQNAVVTNNIQTVDQFNSQAFFIAPSYFKNNLFANNSIQYSVNAITNNFNISYVYSLNSGGGAGTLNWYNNTFRHNTWNATGAIYSFFDTAIIGGGWNAFAAGSKQISFIGDVCNGCAIPDNPSKGLITISNSGTINPYGAQVALTGGSGTSAMTIDNSKMQDGAELVVNNTSANSVTFSDDTNMNLHGGTLTLAQNKSVRFRFASFDNQWHSLEGGFGSGGTVTGLVAPTTNKPCVVGAQASGNNTTCTYYMFVGDPTNTIDNGPALNALLATYPNGTFIIPPGSYKFTTKFTLNRNQALLGMGANVTDLFFPNTSGATFVYADSVGGPNNYGNATTSNLSIIGPGASNTSAVCIYLGGDPAGVISPSNGRADDVNFENVDIHECGNAVQWGNNAYSNVFHLGQFWNNNNSFYWPSGLDNTGEGERFTDLDVFNNNTNWYAPGSTPEVMLTNVQSDTGGTDFLGTFNLRLTNTHFEKTQGVPNPPPFMNLTGGTIYMKNTTFLYGGTGNCSGGAAILLFGNGIDFQIDGSNIYSSALCPAFIQNSVASSGGGNGILGVSIKLSQISGNYTGIPANLGSVGFTKLRNDLYPTDGQMLTEEHIQAGFYAASGQIQSSSIGSGGSGYAIGNNVRALQPTAGIYATFQVTSIGAGGTVTGLSSANNQGTGYSVASGLATYNLSGTGSGLTINVLSVSGNFPVYQNPNLHGSCDVSDTNLNRNATFITCGTESVTSLQLNYAGKTQPNCSAQEGEGELWYIKGSGTTNGQLQICQNNSGTYAWTSFSGSSYVAGSSGGLCVGTCSGQASNVIDILTSVIPRTGNTNTWTGTNLWNGIMDSSNSPETIPAKQISSLPGTCVIGEVAFLTTAAAGQNLNVCNPANTWNTVGSGGGSSVVAASPYLQIGSNYYLPGDNMYQATKSQLPGWIKMMTTPANLTVTNNSSGDVSLISGGVNYSYIMQSASLNSIEISYRQTTQVSNYSMVGVFAVDSSTSKVLWCGEQTNTGTAWANLFIANYNGPSVDPGAVGVLASNLAATTQGHLKLSISGTTLSCSNNVLGTVYGTTAITTPAYLGIVVSNVNAEIYSVKVQ